MKSDMKEDIKPFTIRDIEPVVNALKRLNSVHSQAMTLFVIDADGRMTGTLTDGDIRRGLIAGRGVDNPVSDVMHRDFSHLTNPVDVSHIKELRSRSITLIPILDSEHRIVDIIDLTKNRSALPVDAVLMAGGKGERLRPMTLTTPKPLLEIGGRAIIDRNIDSLINYGVSRISVTVNYLAEQLTAHYAAPVANGVKVECVPEERFYGTIGALKMVKEFENDTILVMNSDILTNIDYEDFYLHFRRNGAMLSAAAIPYTISVPYGIFGLDGNRITSVAEKPVYNLYANAGIYLMRREAMRYIPDNEVFNATDLIESLVADGQTVIRYPLSGLWIDIGTPEEYRKACELARHLS